MNIPDFRREAEVMAIEKGFYTIIGNPDFTKRTNNHSTAEDLLRCIVRIDTEAVDLINNQLRDQKIKERDGYLKRIKAIKDEATRITDNLLLSNAQDILDLVKKFESTEY